MSAHEVVVVVGSVVVLVVFVVRVVVVLGTAAVLVVVVVLVLHGQQYGSSSSPGSALTFWYATYDKCHGSLVCSVVASTTTVLRLHRFSTSRQWNDMQVLALSHSAAHASADSAVFSSSLPPLKPVPATLTPLIKPTCFE